MFSVKNLRTLFLLGSFLFVITVCRPAVAAKSPADEPPAGTLAEGMKVSPTKHELNLRPGQESTVRLEIFNSSPRDLRINLSSWNFARDEKGTAHPISDKDAERFRGAASWLNYAKEPFLLKAQEHSETTVTIKAPEGARPGTHSTYLRISGTPLDPEDKTIAVRYSIDAMFLPIIIGKEHGKQDLLKTKVKMAGFSSAKSLYTVFPISLAAKVNNLGNVHQNFKGAIEIWQGKTKLRTFRLKQTLLPEQVSHMTVEPEEIPYAGQYEAKFVGSSSLAKTHKKGKLTAKISFWYIPRTWVIAGATTISGLLLVIVLLLRLFVRRRRRLPIAENTS